MPKQSSGKVHESPVRSYKSGMRERIFTYSVPDTAIAHGTSLGNAHAWAESKGTGAIQSLFSSDIGLEVTGSLVTGFFVPYTDLTQNGSKNLHPDQEEPPTIVRLAHLEGGEFVLHPAYQEHSYDLIGDTHVKSTFFMPNTGFDDEAVVIKFWEVENRSRKTQTLLAVESLALSGQTGLDIKARYDDSLGAIVFWNDSHPDWVRAFGCIPNPDAYFAGNDTEEAANPHYSLPKKIGPSGNIAASLQINLVLKPGEKRKFAIVVAFTPKGENEVRSVYRNATNYEDLLYKTIIHYQEILGNADIMTPDSVINQGIQWSKANMLRVLGNYPTGIAFTNDPGRSSNVVARDSAWFIYGCDYIIPEASCSLLKQFAKRQEDSGMIIEYYNAMTGKAEDYGLNINDNTPLFILACAHHINVTGHKDCADGLYPAMAKAAEYMISQENDQGLIWCSADGTGVHGIIGWRNIIPNKSISGAVTEVNSEAYSALCAVSQVAGMLGHNDKSEYFRQKAHELHEAVNKHLKNPKNGMYYLNIDTHGQAITEITSDEIFPMIFGIADESSSRTIRLRLNNSDFMTAAGLRTISSLDPQYAPDTLAGLQGGVWPGVTRWYAMASVQADPGLMVESLKRSYEQYVVRPPAYNTVPGQFSEWFDGESLVNHGMRLSPWEPPRFLWAMIEGAVGLDTADSAARVAPRIPHDWKWLLVRNLKTVPGAISFFVAKINNELVFYTANKFLKVDKVEVYDRELTDKLRPLSADIVTGAFERYGSVIACFGNTGDEKIPVPFYADRLLDAGKRYRVRIYQSEVGEWQDMGTHSGSNLGHQSSEIEPYGFVLFKFES